MPKRKRLTEVGVQRIRPPEKGRAEHFDSEVAGLALRVTASGAKSWTMLYKFAGKNRRITFGSYPTVSLKAARSKAREAYGLLQDGNDPAAEKKRRALETRRQSEATFKAACDRYLREHVRGPRHYDGKPNAVPNLRSWREVEQQLDHYIRPRWDSLPLSDISKADAIAIIDPIKAETPYQANKVFAAIRGFFNWAVDRDLLEISPCHGMRRPHKPSARNRPLNDAEIKAFWEAATELGYPFGHAYRLALVTGQRRDECSEISQGELHAEHKEWVLPPERTKNKRRHVVPLTDLALEIIADVPQFEGSFLFSTTHGQKPISGHSKKSAELKKLSELDNFRLHDLRDTAASTMRERLSTTSDVIGQVLNHAPQGVTQKHYASGHSPEDKRRALEAWDRYLQRVIGRKVDNIVELPGRRAR